MKNNPIVRYWAQWQEGEQWLNAGTGSMWQPTEELARALALAWQRNRPAFVPEGCPWRIVKETTTTVQEVLD